MVESKAFVRVILSLVVISFLGYHVLEKFVFTDRLFEYKEVERAERGEGYYEERQKRNARSMAINFAELTAQGNYYVENKEWIPALHKLQKAKSIYPENIDVRKNLCYVYMNLCSEDWRYCQYAKREVYYAHQHVSEHDHISVSYLSDLANLVKLEDIVKMDEKDAMAAIF